MQNLNRSEALELQPPINGLQLAYHFCVVTKRQRRVQPANDVQLCNAKR